MPHALEWAASGLLAGSLAGFAGLWRTRFERSVSGFHYTPDRWLVLLLTVVVVLRVGLGMWQGMGRLRGMEGAATFMHDAGTVFAVAGLLMGYHLVYAWGLRRQWSAWRAEAPSSRLSTTR